MYQSPEIQTELCFPSESPVNTDKLGKQNKQVYEILSSGKSINRIQAQALFITALNSRIADLRNKHGIQIYDRWIKVGEAMVKEYSFSKFSQ